VNVLPLVFSFLIIMALITSTLTRKTGTAKQESRALFGLLQAEANVRTLQARDKMTALRRTAKRTAASPKPAPEQTQEKPQEAEEGNLEEEPAVSNGRYFRDTKCAHKGRQLFLGKLIANPEKASLAYEAALKLLRDLYGGKPFWKEARIPDLEVKILNALIEAKEKSFYDLVSKKEGLGEIFYKILKGTNTYDAAAHEGIPPLLDYFDLEESGSQFVYFHTASRSVLEAFLGSDLTSLIEKEERAKGKPLSQDELRPLVQKHPAAFNSNKIDEVFSFQPPNKTATASIHEITGISYR